MEYTALPQYASCFTLTAENTCVWLVDIVYVSPCDAAEVHICHSS